MSEITQRMAQAIAAAHYARTLRKRAIDPSVTTNAGSNWPIFETGAYAALNSLAAPSQAMIAAGAAVPLTGDPKTVAANIWRAMQAEAMK